jgi:hypothetical protein
MMSGQLHSSARFNSKEKYHRYLMNKDFSPSRQILGEYLNLCHRNVSSNKLSY